MKRIILLLCSISMVIIFGCEVADMVSASHIEPPVCPGIFRTNFQGELIGTWMKPYSPSYSFPSTDPNCGSVTLHCDGFPNPDNGCFNISCVIPYDAHVTVTVVPALGPHEEQNNNISYMNSVYQISGGKPINTVCDDSLSAGGHTFFWWGKNDEGNVVPDGFYRVYVDFDGYVVWVDMFLGRDLDNCPPGLKPGGPEK